MLRVMGAAALLAAGVAAGLQYRNALQRRVATLRAMAYLCGQMQEAVQQCNCGVFDVLRTCAQPEHPLRALFLAVADAATAEPLHVWRAQCAVLPCDGTTRDLLLQLGNCCLQGFPMALGTQMAAQIEVAIARAEALLHGRGAAAPTLGALAGLAGAVLVI